MRRFAILGIITLFVLPAFLSAQSLSEIAKKERERRAGNSHPTAVVDDTHLKEYGAGASSEAEPEPETAREAPSEPGPKIDGPADVPPSQALKSQAELRDERTACYERLAEARRERSLEQMRLREGMPVLVAKETTRGGTWVDDGHGGGYIAGGVPETLYYEQGHVSCIMATRNSDRYPDAAERCDEIEARINALRAEIGNGCDAPK